MPLQELHKPRHNSAVNDLLDGRVFLDGQEATKVLRGPGLGLGVVGHDMHKVFVNRMRIDLLPRRRRDECR